MTICLLRLPGNEVRAARDLSAAPSKGRLRKRAISREVKNFLTAPRNAAGMRFLQKLTAMFEWRVRPSSRGRVLLSRGIPRADSGLGGALIPPLTDDHGVTAFEYTMIAAPIALAIFVGVTQIGGFVKTSFQTVASPL
jgi:Flp pilus assembly pilin Flp